jgi:HEAT repeat protein
MLHLALALTISLAPAPHAHLAPNAAHPVAVLQDDEEAEQERPPVDEKAVADLVERMEKLLGDKQASPDDKVALIWEAVELPHEDVVEALEEGLEDKQHEVQLATLDVLGLIDHEEAMKLLAKLAKKDKKLQDDEDLAAQLFKSLGRYGVEKNMDLFVRNIFASKGPKVVQARLLSLGKIRDNDAVEELIALMNSAAGAGAGKGNGGGGARANAAHMDEIRTALYALLGEDAGSSRDDWQKWWNDNKRDFEVAEEEPELEGPLGRKWSRYWARDTRPREGDDDEEEEEDEGSGGRR